MKYYVAQADREGNTSVTFYGTRDAAEWAYSLLHQVGGPQRIAAGRMRRGQTKDDIHRAWAERVQEANKARLKEEDER